MAKRAFITNHGLVLGYVSRKGVGRQNQYDINANSPLRRPTHGEVMGELLQLLAWKRAVPAEGQMKLPLSII